MSDTLVIRNRLAMKNNYGINVGTSIEAVFGMSYLSSSLQALFACEEFRVKVILFAHNYDDIPDIPTHFRIHQQIAQLYKHMVVGKEAFVIPLSLGFPPNKTVPPSEVVETFIRMVYKLYIKYLHGKEGEPSQAEIDAFPTNCFATRCIIYCQNRSECEFQICKTDWFVSLVHVEGSDQRVVQREVDAYVTNTRNSIRSMRCDDCNEESLDCEIRFASFLILSPATHQRCRREYDIAYNIRVEQNDYELIAMVCYEQYEQQFYSYTKLDEQWCFFKGKFVETIKPHLIGERNVALMIFRRRGTTTDPQCIATVNDLIPALQLTQQRTDYFQWQPTFKPLRDRRKGRSMMLQNESGTCYMNATIQAFYFLKLFRAYITACDERLGRFHGLLKNLFVAINEENQEQVNLWHQELIRAYLDVKLTDEKQNMYFYGTVLKELEEEIILFNGLPPKDVSNETDPKSRLLFGSLDPKNYAETAIGREDMSWNSSWTQHIIDERDNYVSKLFSIQEMSCERCRFGHKTKINFRYNNFHIILYNFFQSGSPLKSIQDYINFINAPQAMNKPNECLCPPESRQWCDYRKCITNASDILVFKVFPYEIKEGVEEPIFHELNIELNEYLIVCGKTYRCVAWTVDDLTQIMYFDSGNGHTWAYVCNDDEEWWEMDDTNVYEYKEQSGVWGMPQIKDALQDHYLHEKATVDMIFYERVDMSTIVQINTNKRSLAIDYQRQHSLADIGIDSSHLQLTDGANHKQLSMQASIVGLKNSSGYHSYMNSVLQCLYHCAEFRRYIIFDQTITADTPSTHYILKRLFVNMSVTTLSSIDPTDHEYSFFRDFTAAHSDFSANVNFDPKIFYNAVIMDLLRETSGLDAQRYGALERLSSFLNANRNIYAFEANVYIVNMFAIFYQRVIHCNSCGGDSLEYRPVHQLLIENSLLKQNQTVQSIIDSQLLMPLFSALPIQCVHCESGAQLLVQLFHVPNILVIRFDTPWTKYIKGLYVDIDELIEVLDQKFSFCACVCCDVITSEHFDVIPNEYLELKSTQVHYYCYTKCRGRMYRLDDASTAQVNAEHTLKRMKNVYMIFYEKLFVGRSSYES